MDMDWRAWVTTALGTVALFLILVRIIVTRQRKIQRLETELRQSERELLRSRSEHAKEVADLKDEHAKVMVALQQNLSDLTALHKERTHSQWDGWLQNQDRSVHRAGGETKPGA
jgi:hypothetical protein